ncbi:MAG: outer membrane lipoprotein-sorting protein [Clostridia bacterium]
MSMFFDKTSDKRTLMSRLFLAAVLIFSTSAAWAQSPDFNAMLVRLDKQSSFSGQDYSAKLRMVSDDPEEGTEVRSARTFRRDDSNAFVILFTEPEDQLGQGYLMVDENLWFYDPISRKFTHTSLKENLQGTDAKNSDLGQSSLAQDYKVASSRQGKLGSFDVWILDLEATNNEAVYPYKRVSISVDKELLLKSEDYSLSKRLLRTAYYTSYVKASNSFVADKILFVDALVPGKKTQFTMSEIAVAPLPDSVFTKAYIERVNR